MKRKLIPVRVGECRPEGVLRTIVYVDLVGVAEEEAARLVLDALKERAKPAQKPGFPGAVTPREERVEPEAVAFPGKEPIGETPAKPVAPTLEFEVVTLEVKRSGGIIGLAQKVELLTHRHPGKAEYRVEDLGNGFSLELMAIPGGTFQMGTPDTEEGRSNDEGPLHRITVKPFLMSKYSIIQAHWQMVAALPKVNQDLNPDPSHFKGVNHPVEQVSWHDAVEFCDRLSRKTGRKYRLPSEAEWEYACRAGTTTPFHFGETITTDLANYRGTDREYEGKTLPGFYGSGPKGECREQTTEVGSFPPNMFGLYDMHGNVWEWCLDHWHDTYEEAPADGSAWVTGGDSNQRLLRGGSWLNNPWDCRSAVRNGYGLNFRYYDIGFRVVCASTWTL
ncbi:SUMF1/EgtB/PvdO family nonheme iron enzyme [Kovacikia minuta]|uniref:SUMF1/EgtB/PvdO family nonheme iron enzyme n=1 Tax=Kovacikia minuta TaxID=2931930 RepID=UPI0036F2AFDA